MAGSISTDVDELIGILRGKGTASIDELANELGVQPKLIESWLYALEDNGKVIVRHRLMRTYAEWIGGGESTTATSVRPKSAREDERMDIRKSVKDEVLRPREFEPIKPAKKDEGKGERGKDDGRGTERGRDDARGKEKSRLEREVEEVNAKREADERARAGRERAKLEEKKTKKDEIAEKKMREMEKMRERQEQLGTMARAKLEEIETLKMAREELVEQTESLGAQIGEADKIYEELEGRRAKITKLKESISRLPKIIKEAEAGVEELRDAEEKIGGNYAEIGHSLEEKMYDVSRIRELSNGKIDEAKRTLLEEVDRLEGLEAGLRSLNEIRERAIAGLEEIRGGMREGMAKADEAEAEIRRAERIDASINDEAGELRRAVRSALSGIMRIDESINGIGEAEEALSGLQADFDDKRGSLARGIMEAEERLEEMKGAESEIMGNYLSELERIGVESGKGTEDIRKREREMAEKLRATKKELDRIIKEMASSKAGSAGTVFEIDD